jgi:hypothetical protein
MPFQEVVEAEGHLVDSHIMESAFDKVVEHHSRFEVEEFRLGRTNSEPSYLRLKVEAPDDPTLARLLEALLELGCAPVDSRDALLRPAERDRCAPEDFYSTTNHRTHIRFEQKWIEVENQRMDALIVVRSIIRVGREDANGREGNIAHHGEILKGVPTILMVGPYRIYFYSHEPSEPPHAHVDRDDQSAKFWLDPVALARNLGFGPVELRRVHRLVAENRTFLLEKWNERFQS